MKFQRRHSEDISVNLTPLIDVVFLLLIFFMVSTSFTKETQLEISLPEASGKTVDDIKNPIEIVINSKGDTMISNQSVGSKNVFAVMSILDKVSAGDNTRSVVIIADAQTPHQAVVTAMEAAGKLGFSGLSISTQQPADP